ncbi:phenylalanine--tRNA ligase beta subunit-related protein [Chloroflexota bacterium]
MVQVKDIEEDHTDMFETTEKWEKTYPEAAVGILTMRRVANPADHPELDRLKEELEADLRSRYAGFERAALKAMPPLDAYQTYYKRFRKTYHVLLQLESIVSRGKSIPRVAALVEAMFMAELKNQLLTAGHDLDVVQEPVRIDVADGSESYVRLSGQSQGTKAGDMMICDAEGILSTIVYGPDRRTSITASTQSVLYTVYAPPGVGKEAVQSHLEDIESYVSLVSPAALVTTMKVYRA